MATKNIKRPQLTAASNSESAIISGPLGRDFRSVQHSLDEFVPPRLVHLQFLDAVDQLQKPLIQPILLVLCLLGKPPGERRGVPVAENSQQAEHGGVQSRLSDREPR